MQVIKGGFQVGPEDQRLVNTQRALTKQINEKFIQVGATFLKPASKHPIDEDWYKRLRGDVDLQGWIDQEDMSSLNVGFNLQFGWLDVDIDASDPEFNRYIIAAMDYLGVDTRFRFGRASVGYPTHLLVQLPEEESQNYDELKKFEPREFRLNGQRYHVQLRSFPTAIKDSNLARSAKQTVVPGSLYSRKDGSDGKEYDISVWYGQDGIASKVSSIASTTPRRVNFTTLVRAVTFGTIAYIFRNHWVEGSRQVTAIKVAGWLARVVTDSAAMNNHEVISSEVLCPVDTDAWAEKLLHFMCDMYGDDEKHMRARTYFDARDKLDRNPDAKIPGWRSMEELIGADYLMAARTVLMPGSDMSMLSVMAERYLYDESNNKYVDRERHKVYSAFMHEGNELERRHKGDIIFVGGKPREAFKVFESSQMRKRVGVCDMFPDLEPGGIYRLDMMNRVIPDESEERGVVVFNTWKGWPITPTETIDPELMAECEKWLDWLLAFLTRDNRDQMEWVKQWVAWIFQHPGIKQQIAWVVVGGQGVGKSYFGNVFMQRLLTQRLWGTAAPSIIEGKFNVGPFKDKMFVFIDEAKFHSEAGTDEIKKLIRNTDVAGQEKFEEARDYRIFARMMFASNRFDVNIGQKDVRDRALFYTRAYDKDHLGMGEMEFREWTETLKPKFDEFTSFLSREEVLRHYVRYFMNLPVDRHKIESIKLSSGSDPEIVESNMTWPRRIVKYILESGYIAIEDLHIEFPFTRAQFGQRVKDECDAQGMRNVMPARVWAEMQELGLIEELPDSEARMYRLTYRYGSALEQFSQASGVSVEPYRRLSEEDFGKNDYTEKDRKPRKAVKASKF